jgi:hypothetical protein
MIDQLIRANLLQLTLLPQGDREGLPGRQLHAWPGSGPQATSARRA